MTFNWYSNREQKVISPLKILAPTRYPWTFNGPRQSRHNISVRQFVPFNKVSPKIEGITFFSPFPPQKFDLVHAFNRLPIGPTPFVIGFESHLPRGFSMEGTTYFELMQRKLASPKCRGIIAISDYAVRQFVRENKSSPHWPNLSNKLIRRYPNLHVGEMPAVKANREAGPLRLLFVGNHFARKGGTVAVRLAQMALSAGLHIQLDVISSLEVGAVSWVDPTREDYFRDDFRLLESLPNVTLHGKQPNAKVVQFVKQADFVLLPTFSDSFGYSAIEAMAHGTPVVVTNQGALSEFVEDGESGIVLEIDLDDFGEWKYLPKGNQGDPDYEARFNAEVDRLARVCFDRLAPFATDYDRLVPLRVSAHRQAKAMFDAEDANAFWDSYYEQVVA